MLNTPEIIGERNSAVLITGGSGLIGRYLTSALLSEGYRVSHLSRGTPQFGRVRVFRWNPEEGIIDPAAFIETDYIVHLAGANIGEKRWSRKRREQIGSSRIDSARLLYKAITENGIRLKAFISASGISYYGTQTSEKIFTEDDPPADDFLGTLTRKLEEAADLFGQNGVRTVKIRSAVVLEKNDSALKRIMMPTQFGFLARTGNSRQYMPWIHINDICRIYLKAIEDPGMSGAYNAVSPQHVTHHEFMNNLAAAISRPLFPVPVPGFLLKIIYGEMADIILKGSRVSSEKIRNAGFSFEFENLKKALDNIFISLRSAFLQS